MELQPWLTVWCLIYKSIHWSVGWLMAIRAFGFLFWVLWKPHNAHSCSAHLSLFLSFSLSFSHSRFIPRCLKLWCQAFSSFFFPWKEWSSLSHSIPETIKYYATGIECSCSLKHQHVNLSASLLAAAETYMAIALCVKSQSFFSSSAGGCTLRK